MSSGISVSGSDLQFEKSIITAGICRSLVRLGVSVAPFKPVSVSVNSFVTDDGLEMNRVQAIQALASNAKPLIEMNPIMVKPGENQHQVVVMGKPIGSFTNAALEGQLLKLKDVAVAAFDQLQTKFEVVICEKTNGFSNKVDFCFKSVANFRTVQATAIDKQGLFTKLARSFGSLWLENKAQLSNQPSRNIQADRQLEIAVLSLPHIGNFTDFDPLIVQPDIALRYTTDPHDLERADLVIVPGTRSTVEDLKWLVEDDLAVTLKERGGPILGLCGGYQILGEEIEDPIESGEGNVVGLGLLPVRTEFKAKKTVKQVSGDSPKFETSAIRGYELRYGETKRYGGDLLFRNKSGEDGCIDASVVGSGWHGIFENDPFRNKFLAWIAAQRRRDWTPDSLDFLQLRQRHLDQAADLIEASIRGEDLLKLINKSTIINRL